MAHHRKSYDTEASPIERFFASYPDFPYNPSQPAAEQYQSLSRAFRWRRGDVEAEVAWAGFRLALVKEFNRLFGTDEDDLLAWQNLCAFVGVPGRFKTINECITVRSICFDAPNLGSNYSLPQSLKTRYFNLVDLIDTRRRGSGIAQAFPTKEALQEYTRRTASYFPYHHPKAGNLLRRLLRRRPRWTVIGNGHVKAKEREKDMLPVSRKSKSHHKMILETIEAADAA